MIVFDTNFGPFTIELDVEKAPISSENFKKYVESGFYDDTIFHRVINNFMIQGGGFEHGLVEKPASEPIQNEAKNGLSNITGTLAMARTSEPHSASSQFFINVNDNFFLDHKSETVQGWGYAVFGKVTEGMETIEKIKVCKTNSQSGHQDVPEEDVIIKSAKMFEDS